ncbi:hypothetical protein P154DRAFT_570941 [Amniculicola lignicola CBS 123094]|uniref:Uncharacterized protein n=1 Tax=Amniculicola lignicola CBS 123094 TaxID=1392246 RepID=A0A6A5X1K3_9PLEO|nr:hypothetical protein P154DRAFT_570941 [Amniculicola lignicola CBS 123094]
MRFAHRFGIEMVFTKHQANAVHIHDTTFNPTRTFYILHHNLFSANNLVIGASSAPTISAYPGGKISDLLRDAARGLSKDDALKHPGLSFGTASSEVSPGSSHSSHELTFTPMKKHRRTYEWVQDSVVYPWRCNGKLRANSLTLYEIIGERRIVVAPYAQRWGSWAADGVLLVDVQEVDEVVVVFTACVMLQRMMWRWRREFRDMVEGDAEMVDICVLWFGILPF